MPSETLMSDNGFPRRSRVDLFTPAERAIYDAIAVVEAAGADLRLTQAVILLGEAQSAVADFVDASLSASTAAPCPPAHARENRMTTPASPSPAPTLAAMRARFEAKAAAHEADIANYPERTEMHAKSREYAAEARLIASALAAWEAIESGRVLGVRCGWSELAGKFVADFEFGSAERSVADSPVRAVLDAEAKRISSDAARLASGGES